MKKMVLVRQPLFLDNTTFESTVLGEPVIDSHRAYTINLNNHIIKADYPRKVVEFKDFQPDNFNDGYLLSIDTSSALKFTLTPLPFMTLKGLGGVSLPSETNQLENKFLALNEDFLISIENIPSFSLFDLGDVQSLTESQRAERDGEVLTYEHGTIASTKDHYITNYRGRWTLRPELKSVRLAGDVRYIPNNTTPINPYRILRQTTRVEFLNTGRLLITDALNIRWDNSPELGGNLDYNEFASFNEEYLYSLTELEQEDETTPITQLQIPIDFSSSVVRLENTIQDLELLNVHITNFPTTSDRCKQAILDISNFEGEIIFTTNNSAIRPQYENGIADMRLGKRNIFNIFAFSDRLYITHKAVNINNPTYLLPNN